jgi:hypothetical protein
MTDDPSITDTILRGISSRLGTSAQTIQKIKFGRGAVGKIAIVAVFALSGVAVIGTRLSGDSAILVGIGAIVLIALAVLIVMLVVILKRPEMAVLEGMEVVHYKHLTIGAKDFQPENELPPVPDPGLPTIPEGNSQ